MNKKILSSGFMFGLATFVGLMPLAFTFSQNEIQSILATSFKYVVWFGQATVLSLLFLIKQNMNKKQLIGLSILFIIVPFTFTLNDNGASFLIRNY